MLLFWTVVSAYLAFGFANGVWRCYLDHKRFGRAHWCLYVLGAIIITFTWPVVFGLNKWDGRRVFPTSNDA